MPTTPPTTDRRRSEQPFLYSKEQLLRREPIYLRRRSDKQRLVGHICLAGGLVGLSAWWVIPLHDFAGPVLVTLAPGRGVHVGDLPTLGFLAVAGHSMVRAATCGMRLRWLTSVQERSS